MRSSSALHGPLTLSALWTALGVLSLPAKDDSDEEEEPKDEVEEEHLLIASIKAIVED